MKNKSIAYLTLIAALFLNAACHKCVECTETNSAGEKMYEWREICGKKGEIDEYRKYQEEIVDPGSKIKCVERKTTLF